MTDYRQRRKNNTGQRPCELIQRADDKDHSRIWNSIRNRGGTKLPRGQDFSEFLAKGEGNRLECLESEFLVEKERVIHSRGDFRCRL